MLDIVMLTLGRVETNCYLVAPEGHARCVVIDPADDAAAILAAVEERGWTVGAIWVTHAHYDHILALRELKAAIDAPILMHRESVPLLEQLPLQMKVYYGEEVPPAPPLDRAIDHGERLYIGETEFEVRFCPGHAPGHVAFVQHTEQIIFGGDCLFAGSIGRTDLFGGDYPLLMRSIDAQFLSLPDTTRVLPGHGPVTTIGDERSFNPFIREWHAR